MDQTHPIWEQMAPHAHPQALEKKTTLLREGEHCKRLYYIESGCIRSWFNHDGKDISFQFFLEGQFVSSFESLMFNEPSQYTLETLLPTKVYWIEKSVFEAQLAQSPALKQKMFEQVCQRLRHYQHLFLSRIKDTPEQRYRELIAAQPELIKRVPQHYIASYLGITSVSLSRIRNR
ncbi:Crp/Fnr family transcriptional regulator [Ferrimonas aestuarii]|uniref:Crp/Fnr family transcriptional regulator n=1 Tax=Ferrimonas aestuarii TaxID=2569539 RepID=A0A4U1BQU4_9GAMM|nr:Crp/Fnr family transcriptional regulator [Ferrimonas aestuarii]TKB56518.1 Crp/Fnr family transcriptional regulator [Ferrimonas aestuarii]